MPIYEFECRSCGNVWDALQKISDPDPDSCPSCHAPSVTRRMTAAAFRLKGAGWYETDFKKDSDSKRNLVDSKTESAATETASPAAAAPSPASPAPSSEKTAAPAPAAAPVAAPKSDS